MPLPGLPSLALLLHDLQGHALHSAAANPLERSMTSNTQSVGPPLYALQILTPDGSAFSLLCGSSALSAHVGADL